MNRVRSLLLLLPLLSGACATVADEADYADPDHYPALLEAMRDFEDEQARFAAANQVPQKFEFPGQGTVTVRHVSLDGYPGNTYVRCRFHYRNDTDKPVLRTLVSLDVLDPEGRMIASKVSVLIFPTPRAIYPGTYYSDELRTQTHDVHLQPGWSWRVTCKTEFMLDDDG